MLLKTTMSSRERMLLAIDHQEADHVPLIFSLFQWTPPFEGWDRDLDTQIRLGTPSRYHPEVKVRSWREEPPGERYPLLHKVYETPEGPVRQVARETDDWPHGDDVPLVSDYLIPRSLKFAVEDPSDLDRIPYLFHPPDDDQIRAFTESAGSVLRRSRESQSIVIGSAGGFGDYAAWLMGQENLLIAAMDRPGFVHQLLDTILEWEMRSIELLLESEAVDVILHRGWYECADFWPPPMYREFIAPRLSRKIKLVHQAGRKFGYIMSTGIMPLLDTFRELDFDLLIHVDPVQGGADLPRLKREIGNTICLWGGVNSAITLGRGNEGQIREAVTHAVSSLAPSGGLILSAADALFSDTSWKSVKTMIDRWREIGSYPVRVDGSAS